MRENIGIAIFLESYLCLRISTFRLTFVWFVEKVVQRGEKLSELEDKTTELESDAGLFRGRTIIML